MVWVVGAAPLAAVAPLPRLTALEDRWAAQSRALAAQGLCNGNAPGHSPDAILREVWERTGDKPFGNIDEVISKKEIMAISDGYKKVAGYDRESLRA